MNKILHTLLCSAALLWGTVAHAQSFNDGTYKYTVNTKAPQTVTVDGLVNPQTAIVDIPATATNGATTYTVTGITRYAFIEQNGQNYITNVTLPASLKTIGLQAFQNCAKLKTVVFKATEMNSIGDNVFRDCITLETVQMPGRLTTLGSSAFYQCRKLQSMVIPEGVKEVQGTTFNNCESLVTLTLPSTLEIIRAYSLGLCTSLKTLHIPASVKTIEPGSFRENRSLESITVDENNPNFVSVQGVLFKRDMTRLMVFPPQAPMFQNFGAYYVVPKTVTHIGYYAFNYCPYTHITLPSGLQDIGENAFMKSSVKDLTIPASVTTIRGGAFSGTSTKLYMMSDTPPASASSMSGHTVYVKPSALANYKGVSSWSSATLQTEIPFNVQSGWNTRCFDFDVQCPADGSVTPYAVRAFDPSTHTTTLTPFAGGYIPSRQGADHNEYVGVLLKVAPGVTTVKVTMGENDYLSGHQTTYDGDNYLVGATVPTFVTVKETRGGTEYTNFVLSKGEFRLLSQDGIIARTQWNRAYLSLPLTSASPAKAFTFFLDDSHTTGIKTANSVSADDDAWYTLGGVRVSRPQRGIYIHNGHQVIVR